MDDYCKKLELTTTKTDTTFENVEVLESSDAYNIIKRFWHEDISIYESFFILILNQANKTIAYAKISQGGTASTIVDKKIIAKYALDCLSPAIILAHNHPSGNPTPSEGDISITKEIKKGLKLLDIKVLDHLILFENGYTSMADENLL